MARIAYIALGSNLESPVQQLHWAFSQISQLPNTSLETQSSMYQSAAIGGPEDQPDYINAACKITTDLNSYTLLKHLQAIEHAAGRVRDVRWGPRTLDLDIIWIEHECSDDPILTLPHPRAHQRAFVVLPLLEIGADISLAGHDLAHWQVETSDQIIEIIG
ncbi:2-amino-4-hydroxy-6-hydroxymethyldihydropteridine diphosphokinase [Reinekea forsetii]|nr:2-amino-4-hydroxy-6-hydroxymethyldihydropteridine diphosphokinase [Reinekea forsetii]